MITFDAWLLAPIIVFFAASLKVMWHLGKISGLNLGYADNKSIIAKWHKSVNDWYLRENTLIAAIKKLDEDHQRNYNALVVRYNSAIKGWNDAISGSNSLPPLTPKSKTTKSN